MEKQKQLEGPPPKLKKVSNLYTQTLLNSENLMGDFIFRLHDISNHGPAIPFLSSL
jgi:hypothetical protein